METITITVHNAEDVAQGLVLTEAQIRKAVVKAMRDSSLAVLSIAKSGAGVSGRPVRRSGVLYRSLVAPPVEVEGDTVTARVGSTMPYGEGYAAILEKGGPLPAMTIRAKPGKVLAWPTGLSRLAFRGARGGTATRKQARGAAIRASNRLGGGGFAFARSVKIPARYQRAMPYLRPALEIDRPNVEQRLNAELATAKKGLGVKKA
jgi:hypothetical protein